METLIWHGDKIYKFYSQSFFEKDYLTSLVFLDHKVY